MLATSVAPDTEVELREGHLCSFLGSSPVMVFLRPNSSTFQRVAHWYVLFLCCIDSRSFSISQLSVQKASMFPIKTEICCEISDWSFEISFLTLFSKWMLRQSMSPSLVRGFLTALQSRTATKNENAKLLLPYYSHCWCSNLVSPTLVEPVFRTKLRFCHERARCCSFLKYTAL